MDVINTGLYLQARPDERSNEIIRGYQAHLVSRSDHKPRLENHLHLTILHVGIVKQLIASIQAVSTRPEAYLLEQVVWLSASLQALNDQHNNHTFMLQPVGFETFGAHNGAYVMTLDLTPEIEQLHYDGYGLLRSFLKRCDIPAINQFIEQTSSLHYAPTIRPHVTLVKSYGGPGLSASVSQDSFGFVLEPVMVLKKPA